jgi:hypothetical protein
MTFDKNILSIDSDDDNENYEAFSEYLENDTERKKNLIASEFEEIGEELLTEIEIKKTKQEIKKDEYISYILKHDDNTYSEKLLKSYSYEDVRMIYDEIKNKNRPAIVKFFHFLFNFE